VAFRSPRAYLDVPGIVQKKQLEMRAKGKYSFPRVHALVYSVEDGILKELDIDHHKEFEKHAHWYDLYGQHKNDLKDAFGFVHQGDGDEIEASVLGNASEILLANPELLASLGLDDHGLHPHEHWEHE
jgi:hypothetical protein